MSKVHLIIFMILLSLIGCDNVSNKKIYSKNLVPLRFDKAFIEPDSLKKLTISNPCVIEIFANDLDYDKYEKENLKQSYYDFVDFQGYYSSIIQPLLDSLKLETVSLKSKRYNLAFQNQKGITFITNISFIKEKQGLILFNGIDQPTFWNGQNSDGLESYLKDFFIDQDND